MRYPTQRRLWLAAVIGGASVLGIVAAPALAHHSFAMYDRETTRTFTGKLIRFNPGANHAQLIFELVGPGGEPIVGDDGEPVLWGVETGPAQALAREGVTVKSFPLGSVLTVTLNPLRDGRNFGALARGTPLIRCDTAVPQGGCTVETGEAFLGGE